MEIYDAKKTLGQHWLNDQLALKKICQLAELKPADTVLEIGPGHGSLTQVLATTGAQIIGLELDQDLIDNLSAQFKDQSNVKIAHGDIRTYDLTKLPVGYKIVANIPYYLTAYLLRLLTTTYSKPSTAILLIQKEVAERLAAKPGHMSVIAVAAQLYYQVELSQVVKAGLFTPPPKVDSQIVLLKKREKPLYKNSENIIKIAKLGFASKRKTLVNNLTTGLRINKKQAEEIVKRSQIDKDARAQELSLIQWGRLNRYLNT